MSARARRGRLQRRRRQPRPREPRQASRAQRRGKRALVHVSSVIAREECHCRTQWHFALQCSSSPGARRVQRHRRAPRGGRLELGRARPRGGCVLAAAVQRRRQLRHRRHAPRPRVRGPAGPRGPVEQLLVSTMAPADSALLARLKVRVRNTVHACVLPGGRACRDVCMMSLPRVLQRANTPRAARAAASGRASYAGSRYARGSTAPDAHAPCSARCPRRAGGGCTARRPDFAGDALCRGGRAQVWPAGPQGAALHDEQADRGGGHAAGRRAGAGHRAGRGQVRCRRHGDAR